MNYVITIAGNGSYDIKGDIGRIVSLEVFNQGVGDLYYGDIPGGAVSAPTEAVLAGQQYLDSLNPPALIGEGMLVQGAVVTAGTYVTLVEPLVGAARRFHLSAVVTGPTAVGVFQFTPPPLDATTGIPILPGNKEIFTGGDGAWLSQQGVRLFGGAGGCSVRIRKKFQ